MSQLKFKNLFVKHTHINWDDFEKMNLFFTNNGLIFNGHASDLENQLIDCNYFVGKKADFNKILAYNFPESVIGISLY